MITNKKNKFIIKYKKPFLLKKKSPFVKSKTRTIIKKKHIIKKENNLRKFYFNFLLKKKISFFKKLKVYFNETRLIWHKIIKIFSHYSKKKWINYKKKVGHFKFFFFIFKLESRLSTLLLRTRFFYKIVNCYIAIKYKLILVNSIILNNTNFLIKKLDLIQKRRTKLPTPKKSKIKIKKRIYRLKWRKNRWKQARFYFWKIRRVSNFNLYFSKKQRSMFNYLEINYKIPAFVLLRMPLKSEILLTKEPSLLYSTLLSKIYFIF